MQNNTRGGKRILTLVAIWVLFTAIVLAIGLPAVRQAIQKSGVLSLLSSTSASSEGKAEQQAIVWFFTADGSLREFAQEPVRRGGSFYHDTLESLLSGPKLEALKAGAVSSIHPDTVLRGLTLSNKILYIDLSRHFLESLEMQEACEQLRRTARGFSQVKDIVLLIEGERSTLEGKT